MTKSQIRLPSKSNQVDCDFIEDFMKKIRFADRIGA